MKFSAKHIISIGVLVAFLLGALVVMIHFMTRPTAMDVLDFETHMRNRNVAEITLSGDSIVFVLNQDPDNTGSRPRRYTTITFGRHRIEYMADRYYLNRPDQNGNHAFYDPLMENGQQVYQKDEHGVHLLDQNNNRIPVLTPAEAQRIKLNIDNRFVSNIWPTVLMWVLLLGGSLIVFMFLIRRMGAADRKTTSVGKSGVNAQSSLKTRFTDVAGAEEEKQELAEIVEFLKSPQKFVAAGARIPRGVLLVGPPGTGKTLFAKAVSGEANVPFFSISGSDFVELYVGVGASRVRDLFEIAKKNKPCIIFIDEIDAVGRQRGAGLGGGHDEREQTLNQLLVQMDGFETNDDVIIMAATNRADILDPALLRPGRFDRQIYVNAPDVRGREEIFKVHARNKHISPDIDFQTLARITSGFTGADISNLLNEAAILAARGNRIMINSEDIYEAINKVTLGPKKKSRIITEVDKRVTAYHEAGHAIVAHLMPKADPVHEVSIVPRGRVAGYVSMRPDNDDRHRSLGKLNAFLAVSMGGRAAEEIVIKDICTGAEGDIKTATNLARMMVTEWGMSDLGPLYYGGEDEVFLGKSYGSSNSHSEVMACKIDEEVKKIVDAAYTKAKQILTDNRQKLDNMARVLIECETIYQEELVLIMEGACYQDVLAKIRAKSAR